MPYSKEVQDMIDQKAAEQRTMGPSFPMPRVRHNGEKGSWMVREVGPDDKLEPEEKEFPDISADGKWGGVILRVAFFAQSKYKPDVPFRKMTREFTDFKNERIELLKQTFGEKGRTETLRSFANYDDFKAQTIPKDEEGNLLASPYELRVALYVWNFKRKQVIRFAVGGSGRTEWFEYGRNKPSGEANILSIPWRMTFPDAKLLQEIKTIVSTHSTKTDKGLEYHRVSFRAGGRCTDEEIKEVFEMQARVNAWDKGWKEFHAKNKAEEVAETDTIAAVEEHFGIESEPMPVAAAHVPMQRDEEQEIRIEDIPF